MGRRIAGGGNYIISDASVKYVQIWQNAARSKNMSLCVIRYAVVRKSYMRAMMVSPFLGLIRFYLTSSKYLASALASSVWGTCMFISSPSKSALKGAQQHSLNLIVFHF